MNVAVERLLALEKQYPNDLNFDALKKYVDFCLAHHDTKIETAERHHILTRASFPAFAKEPKILARLSPSSHLMAHYLLVLALPSNVKALYAFNLLMSIKGVKKLKAGGYTDEEIETCAHEYESAKIKLRPSRVARARKMGRKYGRVQGLKNVESGHLTRISLSTKDDHEAKAAAGRLGGRAGGRTGGLVAGHIAVESGQLARIASLGGSVCGHVRWHINRGKFNPKCSLCQEEFIGSSY